MSATKAKPPHSKPPHSRNRRQAPALMDMLVCPKTRGALHYDKAAQRLISPQAGLAYPIIDGVPIMLIERAVPIESDTE